MTETISQIEFLNRFSKVSECLKFIENLRWWDGIICPFCGSNRVYRLTPSKTMINTYFGCAMLKCKRKFSATKGTIFEGSKIPLPIWFFIIYGQALNKKNISSRQMAINLKITQKTMWGMLHKIRTVLLQDPNLKLKGIIEADEIFISKGNKWTRWGGISTRKAPILGLLERGGNLIIKTIDDRNRETILNEIRHHVLPGSTIYTDGHPSYRSLVNEGYYHDWVDHSTKEYTRGVVHTQHIENIWSMFKKSIRNAHHQISEKHCQIYCNEVAWRYNNRHLTGAEKFNKMVELCLINSK